VLRAANATMQSPESPQELNNALQGNAIREKLEGNSCAVIA
jgi:hypothetical protein